MWFCVCLKLVWAQARRAEQPLAQSSQLISESKLLLVMEPAQPLRFGAARALAARKLTRQGGRPQKPKRPEQRPLAQSSQQPLARSSQQLAPRQCSRNRAFTQFTSNSSGARQPNLNLLRKGKQTPTFTMFPPVAAQKVAARKPRSQIQARTTPRSAKMSMQAAKIEGKRSQPLAQKPGVAQKRKAPPLTPEARCKFRKVFDGNMSETQHLEYHSGFKGFCIRCDMQKRRKVYEACARRREGGTWLATGVRNGLWGLGCTDCASFLASGRQLLDNARFSKFANFKFRPRCGFRGRGVIEQHTKSESHRLACGL